MRLQDAQIEKYMQDIEDTKQTASPKKSFSFGNEQMTYRAAVLLLLLAMAPLTKAYRFSESFEDTPIGKMPPVGWLKWEEAGGRGWSNSWAGRQPMPGWMSGTNTTPPGGGSRMAYVTYTHGGSKTNDLWLISPTLSGITATSTLSFWYNTAFSNFADNMYCMISTNPKAYRKSDFTIEALHVSYPRGYVPGAPPGTKQDFGPWTNYVLNIGSMVPAGMDVRIAFREYHYNNWYDVRASQLDLVESDLYAKPTVETKGVHFTTPTTLQIDYDIFPGNSEGAFGVCWGPSPNPVWSDNPNYTTNKGNNSISITNFPAEFNTYVRTFVRGTDGVTYYGEEFMIYAGDSASEGYAFESFENVEIGKMPPAGWLKWEEAGGRGWSNSWAGRQPLPGWMSGTNSVPPAPRAGTKTAYVTYTHGGSKTNDLWLISPTLHNVSPNYNLSFWLRTSFSNFADSFNVWISTKSNAYRKSDFSIRALHVDYPRGYVPGAPPGNKRDFGPWTNHVINIGSYVEPGSDIKIAFQEYWYNNWYDVRAMELDVITCGQQVRNALHYDGIDDQVSIPFTNAPSAYTIEAWVKPLSSGNMNIVLSTQDDPSANFTRQLRITPGGNFQHYCWDSAEKRVTGTTVIETGQWYHVAGTAQNGDQMRLFVNGVEEGTATNFSSTSSENNRVLGCASGQGFTNFYGSIDEVRFWNTAHSESQIRDSMNIYLRGIEPGLRACYRFDNTYGGDVFDSSTNNNGAYFCAAVDSYIWTHEAPEFDGVDDYEVIPYPSTSGDYSIEAWVYSTDIAARNIMVLTHTNPMTMYARQLNIDASGRFEFYSYDGVTRRVTGTTVVESNTWYHVAGTAKNGGFMRLYVNGVEENSALAGNTLWATGDQFRVGCATGGGRTWFKGRIRGASITNEILEDFNILPTITNLLTANSNIMPQWISAETPQGDYMAAEKFHPRGAWTAQQSMSSTNGMTITSSLADITNFIVCGDNNATGSTGDTLPPRDAPSTARRLERIWYSDIHGETSQVVDLTFNPALSGAPLLYNEGAIYNLLYRENTIDVFTDLGHTPASILAGNIIFTNVALTEGFYTLGRSPTDAPDILVSTNITAHTFYANWATMPLATNYFADVSANVGFTSYVTSYNNRVVGDVSSMLVTGLAPSATFYYRVRTESAGGISTNSATGMTTTLSEGAMGFNSNELNFVTQYSSDPAPQLLLLTNHGDTAYIYLNELHYDLTTNGWLSVLPTTSTVQDHSYLMETAHVAVAGLNVGVYRATNNLISGTATNSPLYLPVTLTINKATAGTYLEDLNQIYDGAAKSITATTDPAGLTIVYEYNSLPSGPTNAGNYTVIGTVTNMNYEGASTGTLTIAKAIAPVYLNGLTQIYNGSQKSVTATTDPAGLTVTITYDGIATAPVNANTYTVTGRVFDANYTGVTVNTFTIDKSDQTIAYTPLSDQLTTNLIGLAATATSSLPVSFTVDSGPAVITAQTNLTFTNAGAVVLLIAQGGDTNWNPAPTITNIFNVTKVIASVTLSNLTHTYDGAPKSLTSRTSPTGLTVNVTYNGSPSAPLNAGSYAVTGTVVDAIYQGSTSDTFTIQTADQSILFPAVPDQETTNVTTLTASSDSGLPVSYEVVSGPAVVSNQSNLTYLTDGVVLVRALQAGDTNWNAAPNLTNTFNVIKAVGSVILSDLTQVYDQNPATPSSQTSPTGMTVNLTFDGLTNQPLNVGTYNVIGTLDDLLYQGSSTGTFTIVKATNLITFAPITDQTYTSLVELASTANSGLPVSFAVGNGPGSISGNTNLSFTATGSVRIIASQAGNTNWLVAPDITNTFMVNKADQAINFPAIPDQETTNITILTATAVSGLQPTFEVVSGEADIADQSNLTYRTDGVVVVRALQAGDAYWNPAPNATNTFNAIKAVGSVILSDLTQVYDTTAKRPTSQTGPTGLTVNLTFDGLTNEPVNVGTYEVIGTMDDLIFQSAATDSFVIVQATQTISFAQIPDQVITNEFGLTASGGASTNPVVFAIASGPASIAGNTNISFNNVGQILITANQASDSNYLAASTVTNTFLVSPAAPFISTPTVSNILAQRATLGGTIDSTNGTPVTDRGVRWRIQGSTNYMYDYESGAFGTGAFSLDVIDITAGVTNFYQAYAINVSGTVYTVESSFLALPDAPESLAVTGIDTYAFQANWNAAIGATNYLLDVALDSSFSNVLTAYNSRILGVEGSEIVTGLVESTPYFYRLRAENDQGISTNSATISATTLTEGAIGIEPISMNFVATYDYMDPEVQVCAMTNFGQTGFDFTNDIAYSVNGADWLSASPATGSLIPYGSQTFTSAVDIASLNAGTYYATNAVVSPTATNSPQSVRVTLVVTPATQTIAFAQIPDMIITDTYGLNATGGASTNPITFAVLSGPASITAGTNLSFNNVGEINITADQAGDSNYLAAITVTNTFYISPTAPAIDTPTVSNILAQTAALGGTIQSTNGAPVTERGVIWRVDGDTNIYSMAEAGPFGTGAYSMSVTGIIAGVTNFYQAYAINVSGTASTVESSFLAPPDAPESLAATGIDTYTFQANWNAAVGATNYLLDVALDSSFSNVLALYNSRVLGTTTSSSVTGLTEGTTYFYRLRAENAQGISTNSATISATTLTEGAIGIDPMTMNFVATYNYMDPDVQVCAMTNFGQTGFDFTNAIAYSVNGTDWLSASPATGSLIPYGSQAFTSAVDITSLNAGTYYATNSVISPTATNSPQSVRVTLVVTPATQTIAFAQIPDMIITDTYGLNATGGASTNPITFAVISGHASITAETNLSFNNVGEINITADQAGDSNYLAAITVTNTFYISPTQPVLDTPTVSNILAQTAALGGTIQSTNGAPVTERGVIWRVDGDTNIYSMAEAGPFGTGAYSMSVTGIIAGVTNFYQAYAINVSGTAYTVESSFLAPPDAPESLAATGIDTYTFQANWNAAIGATNYLLDVALDSSFSNVLALYNSRVLGTTTSSSVTGLTEGTTYFYRLRAENAQGISTNSATISATTLTEGAIGIDPMTMNFVATYDYMDPEVQVCAMTNFGQTGFDFTNAIAYSVNGTDWLSASPATGSLIPYGSQAFTSAVDITSLNAGTYYATNSVISPTATNSPQSVRVTLVVTPATQTIAFAQIPDMIITDTYGLNATGGASTNPITFAVISGHASITAETNLSFNNVGEINITADQAGDSNYLAAITVTNTFYISPTQPVIDTPTASNIFAQTASLGGTIQSTNGAPVTERGSIWRTVGSTNIYRGFETGAFGTGAFSLHVTGIVAGVTNFYQTYAVNVSGTVYTVEDSFLARPDAPEVLEQTNTTPTSFYANWEDAIGATTYYLDVSETNSFDSYLPGYNNIDVTGLNSINVTGLGATVWYYYRLRTLNDAGLSTNSATMSAGLKLDLIIDAIPTEHDTPAPLDYGTHNLLLQRILTNSVTTPTGESNGIRYACSGWSGLGSVPATGNLSTVSFFFAEESTLTWHWKTQYMLTHASTNGIVEGLTSGWQDEGWIFNLQGSATNEYVFNSWLVDGTNAGSDAILILTADAPHAITATFVENKWDLNATGTVSLTSWYFDPAIGNSFATFEVCNPGFSDELYMNRFVYAMDPNIHMTLTHPQGTTPDGKKGRDITAEVLEKLLYVGNHDQIMDPGECVYLNEIEFNGKDPMYLTSYFYSKKLHDMAGNDTDGDTIPNYWEENQGLNPNNPMDGNLDPDNDGIPSDKEYIADTNPFDDTSYLHIDNIYPTASNQCIEWIGGTAVIQYLEWLPAMSGTVWEIISSNTPPTPITNQYDDSYRDTEGYYRVRAVRQQ